MRDQISKNNKISTELNLILPYFRPTFDKFKRDYLAGIETNYLNMQSMYGSEWIMRLYYNIHGNQDTLNHICNLACANSNIELCNVDIENEVFDFTTINNATVHIGKHTHTYGFTY